ncbi:MAG: GntR family transcriptional regulator [Ruthenibacterium sp.]
MNAELNTSEHMYQLLKQEILTLHLKPGAQLSENELCKRFNVSRTPIRAVLQRLQNAGLVTIVPYKSTAVSLLNFEEIKQLIYMRVAVESMVLRDFIACYTPTQLEKVRYVIRKQIVLLEGAYTSEQFYALDGQLHAIWFSAIGMDGLWRAIQKAQTNYTRFRMLDIVATQNFSEIIKEHETLFRILETHDAGAVEPFMKKHLNGGIDRLGARRTTDFADYFIKS